MKFNFLLHFLLHVIILKNGWLQSKYVLSMDWNFIIIHETCYASCSFISYPIQTRNNNRCTYKIHFMQIIIFCYQWFIYQGYILQFIFLYCPVLYYSCYIIMLYFHIAHCFAVIFGECYFVRKFLNILMFIFIFCNNK